jgi:hypothetical protein
VADVSSLRTVARYWFAVRSGVLARAAQAGRSVRQVGKANSKKLDLQRALLSVVAGGVTRFMDAARALTLREAAH